MAIKSALFTIRKRAFVALAVVALAGALTEAKAQQGLAPDQITVQQAYALAEDGLIMLVDIRRPEEWQSTGIPKFAFPIDMRRTDFAATVAKLAAEKPVALICARGVRSRRTTTWLRNAGVHNIIDVPEGMLGSHAGPGWLNAPLPVEAYETGDKE